MLREALVKLHSFLCLRRPPQTTRAVPVCVGRCPQVPLGLAFSPTSSDGGASGRCWPQCVTEACSACLSWLCLGGQGSEQQARALHVPAVV